MQSTQTAVRSDARVPIGHILVCERWKNTDLALALQGHVRILYEEDLGVVDFHPGNSLGVVYLSEADIVAGSAYKRKLVKFRKANQCKGVVLVEKTPMSSQYYQTVQRFVMLDLGLVLLPVTSQSEAGSLLVQMVNAETKADVNPFRKRRLYSHIDTALLDCLQCIPKLGNIKVKALLQKFHSIEAICNAPIEELTSVLGKSAAQHLNTFINQK